MKAFFVSLLVMNLLLANQNTVNRPDTQYLSSTETNQTGINETGTIVMDTPPFKYYLSDHSDSKSQSINLKLKSCKTNKITDEAQWFSHNKLTLNTYQVPMPESKVKGDLPDKIDLKWQDLKLTKAFHDNSYIYCTYGNDYSEGYILNIYKADTCKLEYSLDFSEYRYSPEYVEKDYDFIQQRISWAIIKDNILYVAHSHRTYAKSSKNMNAYITAIDLTDMSVKWRTRSLVCNSENFMIAGDVILCGYGFTSESDYLYQIDIHTGKALSKIQLKTAPTYILQKNNILYVRTYNRNYEFNIN